MDIINYKIGDKIKRKPEYITEDWLKNQQIYGEIFVAISIDLRTNTVVLRDTGLVNSTVNPWDADKFQKVKTKSHLPKWW